MERQEPILLGEKCTKGQKEQTLLYSPSFYLILFFAEAIIKIAKSKGKKGRVDKNKSPLLF